MIPRRMGPPADGLDPPPDEPGFFDPGLVGFADSLAGARVLRWWRREVEAAARSSIAGENVSRPLPVLDAGLLWFGHQRVTDPGLGVARWNRDERALRLGDQGWEVRGHPLRLVRYEELGAGAPPGPWSDLAGQHAGWVESRTRASDRDQADTDAR